MRNNTIYQVLPDEADYCHVWDPIQWADVPPIDGNSLNLDEIEEFCEDVIRICDEFELPYRNYKIGKSYGAEVGDDRLSTNRSPLPLAIELVAQERVYGMVTSWEDTTISKELWNFCEITNSLPTAKEQLFDYCRKADGFDNLGFVDVPPLRIILDVSKGDGSHSSTASGKASMLASRLRTPRDEFLPYLMLASYIQDGMLRTSMSSDPKYLPNIMAGSGCRPIHDEAANVHLYVHAYKHGRCARVYGTATRELYQCLETLETRNLATMPILCHRLRDKQEYLHGTYAEKVFIPTTKFRNSVDGRLPNPLLENSGGANWFSATENRLVRTKFLVTRTTALREWSFTNAIRERLLQRGNPVKKLDEEERRYRLALRREFDDALNANVAFANLLARNASIKDVQALIGSDKFLSINTGVTQFSLWDAEWLTSGGKSEFFSIEDLTLTEDLFLRTEVSEEETFKVPGLTLHPITRDSRNQRVETSSKVGLFQISSTMLEWAERKTQSLLNLRGPDGTVSSEDARSVFYEDREWVNDDTHLIGQCLHDTAALSYKSATVLLVSADKRLANKMANTCNVLVHLLHPVQYIKFCREGNLDPDVDNPDPGTFSFFIQGDRKRADPYRRVYVDTGSVASFLTQLEQGDGGPTDLYRRDLFETGVDSSGRRFERYGLEVIPNRLPSGSIRKFHPVLTPKKFRGLRPRYSSSSYGRKGSYRTSSGSSAA